MELNNYTPRQIEVFESFVVDNPKILICSGAKRAGKTFILIKLKGYSYLNSFFLIIVDF